MKKIWSKYWEHIRYFVTNKKYIVSIILVAILSYGFRLTHYTIGIDSLCLDRYVNRNIYIICKKMGSMVII